MSCTRKLERDLVRKREWDYAASAFHLSDADREKLRQHITREYGTALELITPHKPSRSKKHSRPTR